MMCKEARILLWLFSNVSISTTISSPVKLYILFNWVHFPNISMIVGLYVSLRIKNENAIPLSSDS